MGQAQNMQEPVTWTGRRGAGRAGGAGSEDQAPEEGGGRTELHAQLRKEIHLRLRGAVTTGQVSGHTAPLRRSTRALS